MGQHGRPRLLGSVGFVRLCEPVLVGRPPTGPGWLLEVPPSGYILL